MDQTRDLARVCEPRRLWQEMPGRCSVLVMKRLAWRRAGHRVIAAIIRSALSEMR